MVYRKVAWMVSQWVGQKVDRMVENLAERLVAN